MPTRCGSLDLRGWERFSVNSRVIVKTPNNIWRLGTVTETPMENSRAIEVRCDEQWHDNFGFHDGRGATVKVYMHIARLRDCIRLVSRAKHRE